MVDVEDIDLLSYEIRRGRYRPQFDLNDDDKCRSDRPRDLGPRTEKAPAIGDADLNGEFNSNDFVQVFQAGKYETALGAGWAEGDWDASRYFRQQRLCCCVPGWRLRTGTADGCGGGAGAGGVDAIGDRVGSVAVRSADLCHLRIHFRTPVVVP